jgi:Domain of Unknown Function (DUF928)
MSTQFHLMRSDSVQSCGVRRTSIAGIAISVAVIILGQGIWPIHVNAAEKRTRRPPPPPSPQVKTYRGEAGDKGGSASLECLMAIVPAILVKPEEVTQANATIDNLPNFCPKQNLPSQSQKKLTEIAGGYAMSERPSFWFYVPYTGDGGVVFVLRGISNGNSYEYTNDVLRLPKKPGFVEVKLPADRPGLSPNQQYQFSLTIYPDGNMKKSPIASVSSLVERREYKGRLPSTEAERYEVYKSQDLWFDQLASIMSLRKENSASKKYQIEWDTMLNEIGLDPLISNSTSTQENSKP